MNLIKRATVWLLALVMVLGMIPQTAFAEEKAASPLEYEIEQKANEDKTEASIPVEVVELEEKKTGEESSSDEEKKNTKAPKTNEAVTYAGEKELDVDIQLKGATFFDGTPWSGTTQTIREYNRDVPYTGWQLMQLTVEIPYQDGLEITSIEPSADSIYPEYSQLKRDDKNSKWTYTLYFYDNGTYNFTINYSLNGTEHTTTKSYTVEGLVFIKDVAMRRHLINTYGDLTGLSYQGGQYVTKEILAKPLYDTWGNLVFDFGKDGDNGSTAEYTTSLDGLQYLTNIHGMYLFDCSRLAQGETIEPVTQGYYPNMKSFRVSNLNKRPNMPTHAYNAELVTKSIANMPALTELVINGTGFSDCSVFKEIKEGNLSYLQAMANNIVDLNGIESQPNLSSVNIGQNQIKSIEPLSKLNEINFVNLMRNRVFDLRPLNKSLNKEAVAGNTVKGFAAKEQTITYNKAVITSLKDGSYTIELPMPIDIDGTLTDTAEVTVKFGDGNSEVYNTTKSDGKTYISISQNDVDSSKENPFKDAEFSFSFNNNNGTDTRTKGWFTGTVSFKASPVAPEYHVVYEFVSGTDGKSLPDAIIDRLPMDGTKYPEGEIINAKQLEEADKTFEVADGVWTFAGYDADSKEAKLDNVDENGNVKFTGTWIFTLKEYKVNYRFESADKDKELPEEIKNQTPKETSVKHGSSVSAPDTKFDDVEVTDGVWTFKGWTPAEYEDVKGDVEFVGKWEFKRNASIINLVPTINANDKTITVGDKFDPLKDVTATDKEDGDITLKLDNVIENEVDTTKAGTYKVTYKVTDSKGASTTKTIKVTVVEKDTPEVPDKPDNGGDKSNGTGTAGSKDKIGGEDSTGAVKTGDSANPMLWLVVLAISGIGAYVLFRKVSKKDTVR